MALYKCLLLLLGQHRSTTLYVDAAYIVTDRLAWSVGLSVTLMSSAKTVTAELIEMPFGLRTLVGSGNHVLDGGGPNPSTGMDNFKGEGRPIVKYRDILRLPVQKRLNRSRIEMPFGLWARMGPRSHVLYQNQCKNG